MRNNNQAIIRKITGRALRSDKRRNFFIIAAIAMTALLIGFVFSVGMSLLESVSMNRVRFIGTLAHAAVGRPTESQIEQLKNLDYVRVVGTDNQVGVVKNIRETANLSLTLHYFDRTDWEELRSPAHMNIAGSYPQKENEIMVSRWLLEKLGIDSPHIGMEIPLTYYTDSENSDMPVTQDFILSGWFTNYMSVQSLNRADVLMVSQELSQKHGKTIEKNGAATVLFDDPSRILEYCAALVSDLGLSEDQPAIPAQIYEDDTGARTTFIALCLIAVFLVFIGYLLIYNVLYISVSRDVRFYGLLKTLGTTPKQIKRIVTGQVMRLCMVGIPVGVISALLLSLVFVPVLITRLGAVSTEAVVSFSPVIYLGAIFFSLLTALFSALKPAKKVAVISPIEARKYTGAEINKKRVHSSANGKPHKMAFRNIFRDKKRAGVVFFSLFLGITTFITVITLVVSINMDSYVESIFDGDFILEDTMWREKTFDDAFMQMLEELPGFENLTVMTRGVMRLDYTPDLYGDYIADYRKQGTIEGWTDEYIRENFRGFIIGVESGVIAKLNRTLDNPIDTAAFERGEFALVSTDNPRLFSEIDELTVFPLPQNENENVKIPIGGFVPMSFRDIGSGLTPTVFISNALMSRLYEEPAVSKINVNVSDGYDKQVLAALKQITEADDAISLTSKTETMDMLNNGITAMYVLGGGIALVLAFIGVLNFINVMSVSVMIRKLELATLESIGMSRKQVRKMLVSEGLGYSVIIIILVLSIGNAITYGIFKLFQRQVEYADFTYPLVPVLLVCAVVALVCFITPEIVYRGISKMTLVERLREAE
jgi:putative ABC transport system permease protein